MGAERNTTLWFEDNFVGTELVDVEYAKVAEACGVKGVQVTTMSGFTDALKDAVKAQMEDGVTTFIEVFNQRWANRSAAMRKPVSVAGIDKADMRPQEMA